MEIKKDYSLFLNNIKKLSPSAIKNNIERIDSFLKYLDNNNIKLENINEKVLQIFLNTHGESLFAKDKRFNYIKTFFSYLNYKNLNNLDISKFTIGNFKFEGINIPISKTVIIEKLENEISNEEIAKEFGISVNFVKVLRRYYKLNNSPKLTQKDKDEIAIEIFKNNGYSLSITKDKYVRYLINNKIRANITFSTHFKKGNRFGFILVRSEKDFKNVDYKIFKKMDFGKVMLKYKDLCKLMVFIGIKNNERYIWILLPNEKILNKGQVLLSINEDSIHNKWRNNWAAIDVLL